MRILKLESRYARFALVNFLAFVVSVGTAFAQTEKGGWPTRIARRSRLGNRDLPP